MVERSLSMREVAGSMPAFSSAKDFPLLKMQLKGKVSGFSEKAQRWLSTER